MPTDYENAWRPWMHDYNEGLGLVYERLILNLIAIFGFGLPLMLGLRILRRAGREAREQAIAEQRQKQE